MTGSGGCSAFKMEINYTTFRAAIVTQNGKDLGHSPTDN